MSKPYEKIETLFDRDKDTFKVDISRFRKPEFRAITRWVLTEKIDGTNIRLHFVRVVGSPPSCTIGGRTDNAQIPAFLLETLQGHVDRIRPEVGNIMEEYGLMSYTLYGEGYGARIQKGGGNYIADGTDFILFDVRANDTYLAPGKVEEAAFRLGLPIVPVVFGESTVAEAVELCQEGFYSYVANTYGTIAEGVVATPITPLYDSRGNRIIWKLKYSDFAH